MVRPRSGEYSGEYYVNLHYISTLILFVDGTVHHNDTYSYSQT